MFKRTSTYTLDAPIITKLSAHPCSAHASHLLKPSHFSSSLRTHLTRPSPTKTLSLLPSSRLLHLLLLYISKHPQSAAHPLYPTTFDPRSYQYPMSNVHVLSTHQTTLVPDPTSRHCPLPFSILLSRPVIHPLLSTYWGILLPILSPSLSPYPTSLQISNPSQIT